MAQKNDQQNKTQLGQSMKIHNYQRDRSTTSINDSQSQLSILRNLKNSKASQSKKNQISK